MLYFSHPSDFIVMGLIHFSYLQSQIVIIFKKFPYK